MHKNLNKNLYSNKLLKTWSEKSGLLLIEDYFLKKYLLNKNGKVIEAGTGGGRIIFEVEKFGFTTIEAFDFVEKMINFCNKKKKELKSSIKFTVNDTTNLDYYNDQEFDYLIYLQQVLCFVNEDLFEKALQEAYRIGDKNSTYLFSFLNWNSKFYNPILTIMVNFFRLLRGEKTSKYRLPWLKVDKKFNWKFLYKNQPQNIWFKEKHIIDILEKNGFSMIEVKNKVDNSSKIEHIHIACKKAI